ncbi:response regulator transcription factor [Enterococcus saccharolyticus]|uniref:DNA-binding response regulator n=1 Tax=Candidatus Enterococcus willemsii TaxID=1857215 RepID=A0ABQ6Z2F4_9ENTE|nr:MULTISPECIES: response regulator transcription factor [Enterococcus]KAF1305771.1 DNA-binding response regulator [Enterococcus sp. CU12B]MCD5001536.1 response regulator transcription factor [Enterococcus saccharolyticus]
MIKSILLVEDEVEIANLISLYLRNEGYEITTCVSGKEAKSKIETETFDAAILDIMLPEIDGLKLLELIRMNHHYPVLMLTAKDDEVDKITGLSIGADDYITKPFKPLEVVARVKAQLRRYNLYNQSATPTHLLTLRGLEMDLNKRTVSLNERDLHLTPKEFRILQILMENQGVAIDSEEIFKTVWEEKYYTAANNTLMVHIRHLREKMEDTGIGQSKYIKTVWGVGYKIE